MVPLQVNGFGAAGADVVPERIRKGIEHPWVTRALGNLSCSVYEPRRIEWDVSERRSDGGPERGSARRMRGRRSHRASPAG